MKTRAGVLEEVRREQCDDDGEVGKEAVGQENLTEPAADIQGFAEIGARRAQRDGGDFTVGQLDERAAEEVADADANVVSARPVTFWLARSVTVSRQ